MSEIELKQGARLSIRIKIEDRCQLTFQSSDGELLVISKLSRNKLKSLLDGLRPVLSEFQDSLAALPQVSLREVGKALGRLHRGGRTILYALFDDDEKLSRAVQMCRSACPNWEQKQPNWHSNSLAPNIIEVVTSVDYGLPVDLFPLLNPLKPLAAETMPDLARTAGAFLGFSAIVKRTFADTPIQQRLRIENNDSFPLKMFWDANLPGAKSVREFFEESAHFDLKGGPWPNGAESSDPYVFCEELAKYLGDPETSFDKGSHRPDQLCYFFCHCDTSTANPDDYLLFLNHGGLFSQREVKLQSLKDELHQRNLRSFQAGRKTELRPLVFLNACRSASLNPAAATSFPELFLSKNMGFLGFIGTEATVPAAFASKFGEVFYRHFVGGLPVGRALYNARWFMLRKFLSPLGILYTLFANPEIEVRKKVHGFREKLLETSL